MQELNDKDLEQVSGGTLSMPSFPSGNGSTSAGVNANASASGKNSANTFTTGSSITGPVGNGGSMSLAFGFAAAVAS
jgi:bacteriocin-like protein